MLNERTTKKFHEMLKGMADRSGIAAPPDPAPLPPHTFSGTGNVNIVCQTLVVGSLQELTDLLKKSASN